MMDISQLLSMFNLNQQPQQNQPPQNNTANIPIDVLNSYPSDFIDKPINSQKVSYQAIQSPMQPNNSSNNQSLQNPLAMLSKLLPSLMKGNLDINSIINMLTGGGKANILSNLLGTKKNLKKSQQKNSPNYDELKKVDDYDFKD